MAEFSLIQRYFQSLTAQTVAVGIGDDCAVSDIPQNKQLVSCVDTLVAGRHFYEHASPHAIGWKSIAVNLSDLAAMGAVPQSILLALSLPEVDEAWLAEFSRGMVEGCKRYGVQLIGGDTTQSPTLTISVTALGWVEQGKAILRRGAQVGDLICVSGEMGSAAYALVYADSPLQSTLDYPQPQLALGQSLVGYASSMLDVSDGLGQDLGHILQASQVGARICLEDVPCAAELKQLSVAEMMRYILAGGDDYQLCFTIAAEKLQQLPLALQKKVFVIGQIQAQLGCQYFYNGQNYQPEYVGYQHFVSR